MSLHFEDSKKAKNQNLEESHTLLLELWHILPIIYFQDKNLHSKKPLF